MDRAYIEGCHDSIAPCAGLQGALEDGEKGGGASQRKAYSVEEWRSLLAVRYTCVRISFGTEGMWRPEREKFQNSVRAPAALHSVCGGGVLAAALRGASERLFL